MLKSILITGTTAALAVSLTVNPAQAASAATDAAGSTSAVSSGTATGANAAPSALRRATTIDWDISAYGCGRGGTNTIDAQSAQWKNGPDVNRFVNVHQLQRFQGGRWVTIARKPFAVSFPFNATWYYGPSPSQVYAWNLNAYGFGNYRVSVVYKYFRGRTLLGTRNMNTQNRYGGVCTFG